MRIHVMLALAAFLPFPAVAQTKGDAVPPATTTQPGKVHKPLFELKVVLRRSSEKIYDLSDFDAATAVSAITPPSDFRHGGGHSVLLAPTTASPNVLVCFGRQCETRHH